MLAFQTHIKDLPIAATDGTVGGVSDLYFDDRTREIRWLVIDTGNWLPGRRVLLPTSHVGTIDPQASALRVDVTRRQVADGPDPDFDRTVSRQMEQSVYGYYNWAPYWGAPTLVPGQMPGSPMGIVPAPGVGRGVPDLKAGEFPHAQEGDPHLRSAAEVTDYYVAARDGMIGHVEDLLVDGADWTIRAFVIDTRNWWPGRHVVVAADRLTDISWGERTVGIAQTRAEIERAPDYDPSHGGASSPVSV